MHLRSQNENQNENQNQKEKEKPETRLAEVMFLEEAEEPGAVDAEKARGFALVAGGLKRLLEELAFELVERGLEVESADGQRRARHADELPLHERPRDPFGAEGQEALDDVLELAHVARPGILLHRLEGVRSQ